MFIVITTAFAVADTEWEYPIGKMMKKDNTVYNTGYLSFNEYQSREPYQPLDMSFSDSYNVTNSSKKIIILADNDYYSVESLNWRIKRYAKDVSYQGYLVEIYTYYAGNPSELRTWLQSNRSGLEGLILLGDITTAWFEINNFHNWGTHTEYPTDIFLADLDGVYQDKDGDRIYDTYSGNTDIEIWIGRVSPTYIADYMNQEYSYINKTERMIMYLNNCHNYYRNKYKFTGRMANFLAKDFAGNTSLQSRGDKTYIIDLYIDSKYTINNYVNVLNSSDYDIVTIDAHSAPGAHEFPGEMLSNTVISRQNIKQIFFGLEACEGARYTYFMPVLAYSYIFAKESKTLATFGMTSTGANKYNDVFYDYTAQNQYIGQAWINWYNYARDKMNGFTHSYADYYWSWHSHSTLLGNPMIKLGYNPVFVPNSSPTINGTTTHELIEGNDYSIDLGIEDYDDDTLTITVSNLPSGATYNGDTINWKPDYTQGGRDYHLNVTINDGYTAVSKTVTLRVINYKKG